MSAQEKSDIALDNCAFVDSAEKLCAIRKPHINLAVWQRSVEAWPIVHLLAKDTFEYEEYLDVEEVSSSLHQGIEVPAGFEQSRLRLIADIQQLASIFAEYADTQRIRLTLESVHQVTCPKFHQDNITLRLICSYVGVGTDWLENSNINLHPDCCGGNIMLDVSRVQQLKPFEVALMKGKLWPNNDMAIYHRSPELKNGQPRLVVKMDVA